MAASTGVGLLAIDHDRCHAISTSKGEHRRRCGCVMCGKANDEDEQPLCFFCFSAFVDIVEYCVAGQIEFASSTVRKNRIELPLHFNPNNFFAQSSITSTSNSNEVLVPIIMDLTELRRTSKIY